MTEIHIVVHVSEGPGAVGQLRHNLKAAQKAEVDGVFLIGHGLPATKLLRSAEQAFQMAPDLTYGINFLDLNAAQAAYYAAFLQDGGMLLDHLWIDNPRVLSFDHRAAQALCQAPKKPIAIFGGVAFKTQPPVPDEQLESVVAQGCKYLDVITTSGPGTGHAADVARVARIHELAGTTPVALASGVTPENVADYAPYVDYVLVATGVSRDFWTLDPDKVKALVDNVRG